MKNFYDLLMEFEYIRSESSKTLNEIQNNKLYDELVDIGKEIDKQISTLKKFIRKTKNKNAIREVNHAIEKLSYAFDSVEKAEFYIDTEAAGNER